jgi:uncharacterized protein YdaU (DUF1376 family)
MNDPRPAFLFYVRDFFSAEAVELMSFEEVGLYVFLLGRQWETGSIPSDANALRTLCRRNATDLDGALRTVLKCFDDVGGGRLQNRRLEFERARLDAKSDKARTSAKARWDAAKADFDANALRTQCDGNANAMHLNTSQGNTRQSTPLTPLPGGDPAPQPAKRAPRRKPDEGWEPVLARPEYARMSAHPTFARAWAVWIEHTGTAGAKARPPSALAAAAILNRALREGPDRFAAAVEASIAGNWQGIHYPDERRSSQAAGSVEASLRVLRQSALDLP